MKDITLNTNSSASVIHCGNGAFEKYAPKLRGRQLFVVTDTNVHRLYGNLISETFGNVPVKILPAGEASKNRRSLFSIIDAMTEAEIKRTGTVIAFGGGVIGDIAGLAAALYMRGVHLVQIPTTLLSQVDSSVGGKTAVDYGKIKNLIGTFYQPQEVIADPRFLKTLPAREIKCGLGEIIKHGALDKGIFKRLSEADNIFDLDFLGDITADNIRFKADVVSRDERETTGLRKILNLGHTTGHAFELYYGRKSHGEFVLIGMNYEMYVASTLGIGDMQYYNKLISLIKSVIKKIPAFDAIESAAKLAKHDKKNADEKISMIVPVSEGNCKNISLGIDEYTKLLIQCRDKLRAEK